MVYKDFNEMFHHLRGKVEEIIPKEYVEPKAVEEAVEEAKAVEEAVEAKPKRKRTKKEK